MKPYYLLIIICILTSCKSKPAKVIAQKADKPVRVLPASYKTSSSIKEASVDTAEVDEQLQAYANYYVVVADTGTNYDALRNKMFDLHRISNHVIDTMGRYYNKAKNLIALPDNADDDIYAGDYYPRRYPSKNLSLEYMYVYHPESNLKTIALISGIYESKTSADSALNAIKSTATAFVLKSKIYVGCMH